MGLLGSGWDDPQSAAMMALAGGLLQRNPAAGLLGANAAYGNAKNDAMKQQYLQAQIADSQAQAQERQANTKKMQAAMEQAARVQAGIPGLFQPPGMTGGAPQPQTEGGMPMFNKPMGAGPMQATPGGFDVQAALRLGMDPKMIEAYAGLQNVGRPEVARTVDARDPQGRPVTMQYDKYGQPVGQGVPQWKAPVFEGLGNRKAAIDPVTLREQASYGMGQSPDSVAGNAVTMRGQNMTDARAKATAEMGGIPAGYRRTMTGLEFIPGGPADPAAAKKAAPTEFQGKSTTYAARMQDAARIIDELQPEVNPSQVAQAGYKPEFPNWMPGGQIASGAIGGMNKLITPEKAQLYHQAQENWVTANLRQESGAAIGKDEMAKDIAKWFPQPGEPQALIEQKAAARKVAERAMLVQSGPGSSAIAGIVSGETQATPNAGTPDWRYVNGKLVKVK